MLYNLCPSQALVNGRPRGPKRLPIHPPKPPKRGGASDRFHPAAGEVKENAPTHAGVAE